MDSLREIAIHTADRARDNKEALTTLQDVVSDQRQLIKNLTTRLEIAEKRISRPLLSKTLAERLRVAEATLAHLSQCPSD